MKNSIKVLLGMIGFFLILFFIMYPLSIPGKEPKVYKTIEEFEKKTKIPFYRMYNLYDYLMEDKKVLLGEEQGYTIESQKSSKDYYVYKNNDDYYSVFYAPSSFDKDGYYKQIGDAEINVKVEKVSVDLNYLMMIYSSNKVSYNINLYLDYREVDYSKIEEYVKEVEKLNNPL